MITSEFFLRLENNSGIQGVITIPNPITDLRIIHQNHYENYWRSVGKQMCISLRTLLSNNCYSAETSAWQITLWSNRRISKSNRA